MLDLEAIYIPECIGARNNTINSWWPTQPILHSTELHIFASMIQTHIMIQFRSMKNYT